MLDRADWQSAAGWQPALHPSYAIINQKVYLPSNFSLQELLSKARRRELTHLVVDKSALAAIIAMGGAILLLLVGTEILDWYWLVLLAVVSLGWGLYSLRNSIPTLYALAQRIDRRLKLADALSTALYFGQHPDRDRQAVCDRQRQDAEATAREVDLRQALPLTRSRYALPAAGLVLVALGLFGLRYLVTGMQNVMARGDGPASALPAIGILLAITAVLTLVFRAFQGPAPADAAAAFLGAFQSTFRLAGALVVALVLAIPWWRRAA